MCQSKNRSLTICVIILAFSMLFPAAGFAEIRYIGDTLVVSLRVEPDQDSRTLKLLKTGESFTVLEERNNFIKVKAADGTQGWLPKHYTVPTPPNALLVQEMKDRVNKIEATNKQLIAANTSLSEQLGERGEEIIALKKEIQLIQTSEQSEAIRLSEELKQMSARYDALLAESQEILQTQKERDQLKNEVVSLREKAAHLERQNTSMADRQSMYWFLAGGGVFFLGWLIGKSTLRRQKSSLTI